VSRTTAHSQTQCTQNCHAPNCQVAEAEAAAAASREEAAGSRDAVRSAEAARDTALAEAAATAEALRAAEDRLSGGTSQVAQLESQLAEARALQQASCWSVLQNLLFCPRPEPSFDSVHQSPKVKSWASRQDQRLDQPFSQGIPQRAQDAEQNAARALQDVGSWEEERQQLQTEVRKFIPYSGAL